MATELTSPSKLRWLADAGTPAGGSWITYDPGSVSYVTKPGKLGCPPGLPVVKGSSTFNVYVLDTSISFDGKAPGTSLSFFHDALKAPPDTMTIPTCSSYPDITAPAYFWSTLFDDSHKAEVNKAKAYFTLTDWKYLAPPVESWGYRVRVAEYEYHGTCDSQCSELTHLVIEAVLAPDDRQP